MIWHSLRNNKRRLTASGIRKLLPWANLSPRTKWQDRLSKISTVSRADTYAVLKDLADVLSDYMAQGRTVKLEGLGTFYYTAAANGQGVDSPEKVTAAQITGVRIRFIPESTRTNGNRTVTRSLVSDKIFWEEWGGKGSDGSSSGGGSEGGGESGGEEEAPDPTV